MVSFASVRSHLAAILAALMVWVTAVPAWAQTPRVPPVFDQLASPFTESEVGSMGCLVASTAIGVGMLALMGGPAGLVAAARGVMTPRVVLEGSMAGAFVFSSACYIGQALAPLAMLGFVNLMDNLAPPAPTGHGAGAISWIPGQQPEQQGGGDDAPLP